MTITSIVKTKRDIKGVKNLEKTTLPEYLLLKIVPKIYNMFCHVDKIVLQVSKLKKEVLAGLANFRSGRSSVGRAPAFQLWL